MALAAPTLPSPATAHPARRYAPWELWHLLSLDAPTVATLWTIFFARAAGIALPWIAPVAMATGVWALYALDRILDGKSAEAGSTHSFAQIGQLRERHIFHARHQRLFILGVAVLLPVILLLCFHLVVPSVQRDMLLLSLAVAAYLAMVHLFGVAAQSRLPKEILVGGIFACATVIPTWARTRALHAPLLLGGVLFAMLCWLNCVAIESWEANSTQSFQTSHSSTLWAGRHLAAICCGLATACIIVLTLPILPVAKPIAAACALAAAALWLLERNRERLTPMALRVAADAALLTPLLLLPWLLLSHPSFLLTQPTFPLAR